MRRPKQVPPDGPWRFWTLITGRKWGKTRVLSEFCHESANSQRGSAGFIAGRTLGDVNRAIIVHPTSGILATQKKDNPCEVKQQRGGGGWIVRWANGSFADIHTSEEPDRARGPMYSWGVADEVGTWKRVVDFEGNTTWANLDFALSGGDNPRAVVASTPRRGSKLIRELIEKGEDPASGVVVTRGSLLENAANLAPSYVEAMVRTYKGTSIERQEIGGDLLPEVEGAIVTSELIARHRVESPPELKRVVIGVDPSGGTEEQGIVAAGIGVDGHGYLLDDRSGCFSPEGWARRVVETYGLRAGDLVVAERNYGGDMVVSTMRAADPNLPVKVVSASRGKHVRFEPVGLLYEQGRIHHVGTFEKLEDELCCFTPDAYEGEGSPNRADAVVWAFYELFHLTEPAKGPAISSYAEVLL